MHLEFKDWAPWGVARDEKVLPDQITSVAVNSAWSGLIAYQCTELTY